MKKSRHLSTAMLAAVVASIGLGMGTAQALDLGNAKATPPARMLVAAAIEVGKFQDSVLILQSGAAHNTMLTVNGALVASSSAFKSTALAANTEETGLSSKLSVVGIAQPAATYTLTLTETNLKFASVTDFTTNFGYTANAATRALGITS